MKLTCKLLTSFAGVAAVCSSAYALPPLGLTQVSNAPDEFSRIAVLDGTAYVSLRRAVRPIDSMGVRPVIFPTNPNSNGIPVSRVTRVIKADDGNLYFAASFGVPVAALYEISEPSLAIAEWPGVAGGIVGLFDDLTGIGGTDVIYRFLPNGTFQQVELSTNATAFSLADVSPAGLAVGSANIPNTIGAGAATLDPGGTVNYLAQSGGADSVRVRSDGNFNIGFATGFDKIQYGMQPVVNIDESISVNTTEQGVLVSESAFTVVRRGLNATEHRVYFPGVNPAGLDLSVGLFDFFPELEGIDFETVADIALADGQIHLLLSGDDGLWLFAAPDPTVIPEPAAAALCLWAVGLLLAGDRRRSGPRFWQDASELGE